MEPERLEQLINAAIDGENIAADEEQLSGETADDAAAGKLELTVREQDRLLKGAGGDHPCGASYGGDRPGGRGAAESARDVHVPHGRPDPAGRRCLHRPAIAVRTLDDRRLRRAARSQHESEVR